MKKEKVELQEEYENVKKETDDLNNVLFLKSSIVERLKAKLGKQTNVNKELSTKIHFILIEAVVQRCSVKKVSLEISQNSQENNCARVSFLIKLQASFLRTPFLIEHHWWLLLS